jgi:hypothetical protein
VVRCDIAGLFVSREREVDLDRWRRGTALGKEVRPRQRKGAADKHFETNRLASQVPIFIRGNGGVLCGTTAYVQATSYRGQSASR